LLHSNLHYFFYLKSIQVIRATLLTSAPCFAFSLITNMEIVESLQQQWEVLKCEKSVAKV